MKINLCDKVIIEKGGMLFDIHMNAAQKLLGEQFPHLQSLQSTLLSQTSSFIPVSECGGFYPEGMLMLIQLRVPILLPSMHAG